MPWGLFQSHLVFLLLIPGLGRALNSVALFLDVVFGMAKVSEFVWEFFTQNQNCLGTLELTL